MADLRVSQAVIEAIDAGAPDLRVSQAVIEVIESLRNGPGGGGGTTGGVDPVASNLGAGVKRVFMRLTTGQGSPYTETAYAETMLRDDPSWFGGKKLPRILEISPITRELTGSITGLEVRVVLIDDDSRPFRTLAATDTLSGAVGELFVVEDDVRYAEQEPYRVFTGKVHAHRAIPGFRYELVLRDILSEEIAILDDAPRIPPGQLTETDFPGMLAEHEGKAVPIVLGRNDDSVEPGMITQIPQGVIPPLIIGRVNFTYFGGINQNAIACLWSQAALAANGIWQVYVNLTQTWGSGRVFVAGMVVVPTAANLSGFLYQCTTGGTSGSSEPTWPTGAGSTVADGSVTWTRAGSDADKDKRVQAQLSDFGVYLWTPGMPGWSDVGLATDYIDYPFPVTAATRRYTPLFVNADTIYADQFLKRQIIVAGNLYGVAENPDGSGNYFDDAPTIWQWLIVNYLFNEYKTGSYAAIPSFAGSYSIINTASVDATNARLQGFLGISPGEYPVGFMIGADGQQQAMRHTLEELCKGVAMEQGIDRHGRLMLDVEDVTAPIIATFDEFDIEDGTFEVWVDREAYRNRIEYVFGYRYVPPAAPIPTPASGEALPESAINAYMAWTSGFRELKSDAAIAANGGQVKTLHFENRVVRSAAVGANVVQRLLERAIGPIPGYDGPRMFRFTTDWRGLYHNGVEIELGSVIGITHLEGMGASGWTARKGRVLKITVDLLKGRVTLEGRVLYASGGGE